MQTTQTHTYKDILVDLQWDLNFFNNTLHISQISHTGTYYRVIFINNEYINTLLYSLK